MLEALDIISMDKKEIQWIGVENSRVLNETTKKVGASHGNHRRELDEESEEPEDDDMDIEQLQVQIYGCLSVDCICLFGGVIFGVF